MKHKKYILVFIILVGAVMSCRDESLYPLPYNDRTVGAYLRMYSIASNVLNINDLTNSAFETTFEVVDAEGGNLLKEIDFYASYRSGTGLSDEVFIKTVPASVFTDVPEPTYSEYKRATIRITYAEADAALDGAPSQSPSTFWPSLASKINYPGAVVAGDQIVFRWKMKLTTGQEFSVFNPQNTNSSEANTTSNITGGQYYSSPFTFTMTVRQLATNAFLGDYRLDQFAIWSPSHSVPLHLSAYPTHLNEVLFASNQTVTLSRPASGLSTQREFQVNYRGMTTTMKINFDEGDPLAGQNAANTSAAIATLGLTATRPRASVLVELQDSKADCSPDRGLYWVMPVGGIFGSTARGNNPAGSPASGADPAIARLPLGLPQGVIANRGIYHPDAAGGVNVGDVFYIALDDDCDEYGRRNGYCSWTRRVYLRLTKL